MRYFWVMLLSLVALEGSFVLAADGDAPEGLLNKLLAPGALMEGHKDLEQSRCLECHEPRKGIPDSKCLKCHDVIKIQVERKSGFHGLNQKTCIQCHSDHKGREFDSTKVDTKAFVHQLTGFELLGKHAPLKCTECHQEKRSKASKISNPIRPDEPRFTGLQTSCVSCHKKDDVHLFEGQWAKKDCNACHNAQGWKAAVQFNHNRETSYEIGGKHSALSCAQCHVPQPKSGEPKVSQYHWPELAQKTCENCHASPHLKIFSPALLKKRCTECHTDLGWKISPSVKNLSKGGAGFDHSKTRFALTGAHSELVCAKCHQVGKKEVFQFQSVAKGFCIDCHKNVHLGQFRLDQTGESCAECHTTQNFKKRLPFDHSKTTYPLKGKHASLDCNRCHVPTSESFDKRPFHKKGQYVFPEMAAQDCAACHKDAHQGNFGKSCSQCHREEGWKVGSSDFHQDFHLSGVHLNLQCNECHTNGRKLQGLGEQCTACHQKDDIHHASLPDCGQCHQQTVWENPEFKHSLTNFPLRGAHRTLDCSACHSNNIYKGLPSDCSSCHLSNALSFKGTPNHQLLIGHQCNECHNEFSFH